MEHSTDEVTGKADHPSEWTGIIVGFLFTFIMTVVLVIVMMGSNSGQAERLDAIEFRISCAESQRFTNVDGEFFCAELIPVDD